MSPLKKITFALALTAAAWLKPVHADVIQAPGATWEYTFSDPTGNANWNTTTGLGGGWVSGPAPFGNIYGGDFGYQNGTYWPAYSHVWARLNLDLTNVDLNSITYLLGVDNGFDLYANGHHVAGDNAEGYTSRWEYSGAISAADLIAGNNVIAVVLEDHGGATAFDMEIDGTPGAVPEPSTLALLGLGVAGLGLVRRKRKA